MSSICSKIESIDNLWFEPFSAKPVACKKVVSVEGTIVALGENGKIYSNGVIARVAYMGGHDGKISRVLDGCLKLKVLSANAVKQHKDDCQKRQDARDKKWNIERLTEAAEKLGIALSPEQLEKLK